MKLEEIMCKLFNFSIPTYYKRKREKNKAIHFLENNFSKEELVMICETGKCTKHDRLNELLEIEKKYKQIANIIHRKDK